MYCYDMLDEHGEGFYYYYHKEDVVMGHSFRDAIALYYCRIYESKGIQYQDSRVCIMGG